MEITHAWESPFPLPSALPFFCLNALCIQQTLASHSLLKVVHVTAIAHSSADDGTAAAESVAVRVKAAGAGLGRGARHGGGLGTHAHLNVTGLVEELLLDGQGLGDEELARALERVGRVGALVGLDLDRNDVLERVRELVACEENGGVEQELAVGLLENE